MYEVFEHTADLGLRIRAADKETLFAEAGRALFSIVVDLAAVQPRQEESIRVDGHELDYLLFDWLNELLYAFETRRMVFCDFAVTLDERGLSAVVRGEPLDPDRHRVDHEVKAITYHGLKVQPDEGGWLAEVIVDI